MKEKKKSVVEYLKENGPSTQEEIPGDVGIHHRYKSGIDRLSVTTGSLGKQRTVYHLPEHSPENTVRKFLETNPDIVDSRKYRITSLFGRAGKRYREAWLNISDEYETKESDNGGNRAGYTTCPFCENEVFNSNLPDHIVEEHS